MEETMTKLLTAIAAAAALLLGGSLVGTAKAVPMTDTGTLRSISKSNTDVEKVYYARRYARRYDRRAYRRGYGYGYPNYGYGYRPYGYGYGWRPWISFGIGPGWGWGY